MTKSNVAATSPSASVAEVLTLIKDNKGDGLPYRLIFDAIVKAIPSTQVVIVSSLPRGCLQVVQPSDCPELLVKGFNRELHPEDRLTWEAIAKGAPTRGVTAWGGQSACERSR